ncbi:ABC transporter permease [Legionella lansingensis]|uniref:Proton transporter n=1 Tax=Legionella lansingensis TaxID=45067 RepID=A0A0W0VF54_9GAMM|nr:exopolysaccharide biosynthesis protein [Legionella lansingensis]KTD18735.1 proton transporter [Legionella lansingensis]SNV58315.1 ABC transporter permease [Legionella lansingensis]
MDKINNKKRTSICDLLLKTVETHQGDATISFGELVKTFGDRAFGLIIILFALPSALPISAIPGFSFITGLPIVFIAIHIIIARRALWLPKSLANRRFEFAKFAKVVEQTVPYLRSIEKLLKPRWLFFTHPAMERLHGLVMLSLSLLLLLPIPFSNFIFASLIILFGLGLAEKDGVILFLAYVGAGLYGLFLTTMAQGLIHYINELLI